jgi:tetratricopeptide (TPR) repeat protein
MYGLMWTFLAIFPYAVVGKVPGPFVGMDDRHTLLIAVPISIVMFATVRILFSTSTNAVSRVGFALLILVIAVFSMTMLKRYVIWEGRWMAHAAIIENLERMDEASDASIYWVTYAPDARIAPFGLTYSEWSATFKDVWGGETRTGLEPQETTLAQFVAVRSKFFIDRRHLSAFDPAGCQAVMTIQTGFARQADAEGATGRRRTILHYFYHRFFLGPEATEQFLLDLTDIWVEPIAAPEATNCTTTAEQRQQQTVAIYDQIVSFKPQWFEAYYRRGLAYLALEQPAQARSDFTQAIDLRPDFAPAYYERGMAYERLGDAARASDDYQRVLELSSDESLTRQARDQLTELELAAESDQPVSVVPGAQP